MGKGRKRNTARTGDKALYKSRDNSEQQGNVVGGSSSSKKNSSSNNNDDTMYDEIDQYHNTRENDVDDPNFLKLTNRSNDDDSDDDEDNKALMGRQEHVLDLGIDSDDEDDSDDDSDSNSSDESDDDDDDDSDNNKNTKSKTTNVEDDDDDSSSDSSDDDDSDDDDEEEEDDMHDDDILERDDELKKMLHIDPRNWGSNKSAYYHGDTTDLEIGQDEMDALDEEEAAKEIQKERYRYMDEDDFGISSSDLDDHGGDDNKDSSNEGEPFGTTTTSSSSTERIQTKRDVSKLSQKDARKLLKTHYPELLPMVSYFSDIVKDLKDRTDVATKALFGGDRGTAKSVGATREGQQYLLTKAMLQKSIALNSVMYLLIRSTTSGGETGMTEIQSHPVMAQLKTFNSMLQKLENDVEKNVDGIDEQMDYIVKAAQSMGDAMQDSDEESSHGSDNLDDDEGKIEKQDGSLDVRSDDESSEDLSGKQDEDNGPGTRMKVVESAQSNFHNTLNEARFGFRPSEIRKKSADERKRKNDSYVNDYGDFDDDGMRSSLSSKALASTINTLEQRSNASSRNRRPAPVAEELDDVDDEADDRLAMGIKMMEEEMGKLDEDSDDVGANDSSGKVEGDDSGDDDEMDDETMMFYKKAAAKSKTKKSIKKGLYSVAPKFPRKDFEIEGERAISRAILKNRGLVAHKAKINRNPRVKKREQYRKALIRRKGAVREVRTDEGHRYGGEETGIKTGISRSRKLNSK